MFYIIWEKCEERGVEGGGEGGEEEGPLGLHRILRSWRRCPASRVAGERNGQDELDVALCPDE